MIPTAELLAALKISKATLADLRRYGLRQLGEGKQQFYHRADVARAMRVARMVRDAGVRDETPDAE